MKTRKINKNWNLILIIIGSHLYFSKIGFSPVYILIPFFFLITFVRGIPFRILDFPARIFIFMSLIFMARSVEINGSLVNFLCFSLTYISVYVEAINTPEKALHRTIKIGLIAVAMILSLDSIFRILNPGAPSEEVLNALADQDSLFYLYKYNSIMFNDSNTTGLICLYWATLITFFIKNGNIGYKLILFIFIILLIASINRSAIAALTFMFVIITLKQGKINAVLLLFCLIIAISVSFILELFSSGSGQSKVEVVDLAIRQIAFMSPSELIFGYGVGQSEAVLGIFGHNVFVTYFIDLGFVGIVLLLAAMTTYARYYRETWPYTSVILLASLSYFFYEGGPFLAAPLAIMAAYHRRLFIQPSKKRGKAAVLG
jgi:hypothetical protein